MSHSESQMNEVLVEEDKKDQNESPFEQMSFISRILFSWVNPLLKKSQKADLNQDDIFKLSKKDSSQVNFEKFNKIFEEVLNDPKITLKIRTTFYRMFKKEIAIVCLLYFLTLAGLLVNLLAIQLLLSAMNSDDRGQSISPLLPGIFAQLVSILFQSIIRTNYNFYYSLLTIRMTGALSIKIFEKCYTYPILRNQYYKIGDILNFIQVDILQVVNYIQNIIILSFSFPLVAIAIMFVALGLQKIDIILIMLGCAIVYVIIAFVFGRFYGSIYNKFMHKKDLRMRSLEEMFRGIKTIKYNSMESYFNDRIKDKRVKEVQNLRNLNFLSTVNNLVTNSINVLYILIVSFLFGINTYENYLLITTSFTTVLVYIMAMPGAIQGIVVGKNSMKRIDHFLSESYVYAHRKQIQYQNGYNINSNEDQTQQFSIVLDNANFEWKSSIDVSQLEKSVKLNKKERLSLSIASKNFSVKNLNLKIKNGQFVVFCGDLGCGKSSILQGILGEMEVKGGQKAYEEMVQINGKVSLSTQEPWIIQGTVKENIIFGQEYNHLRYKQALQASCLEEDLTYFVDGDLTNIAEKGDSLSGGQRKRINLARAIYKDSDIYFLDDPLSALDIGVATFIARECFNGMLKSKTRVIFVNNLIGMENADIIYIIKDGEIVQQGKYQQIKNFLNKDENPEQKEQEEANERKQSQVIFKSNVKQNQQSSIEPLTKKLIQVEDIQSGTIKKEIYFEFIRTIGGYKFVLAFFILLSAMVGVSMLSTLTTSNMKNIKDPTQKEKDDQFKLIMYFCMYEFIKLIIIFAYESLFVFTMIYLSKFLHNTTVYKLLKASFTKFYNIVTTGRLMNRLSKDIYEIDIFIQQDLKTIMINIALLIVSFTICCYIGNIKVIPIVIVYLFIGIYLAFYFIKAKRQTVRIEATSKSPILNCLSEYIRGIFYLRNCIDYQSVKSKYQQAVDLDLSNQISVNGVQNWFECISSLISVFPLIVCGTIMYFDTSTDVNNATVISQNIQSASSFFINLAAIYIQVETHMVNYERCQKLKEGIVEEDYNANLNGSRISNNSQSSMVSQNSDIQEINNQSQRKNKVEIQFKNACFIYRENLPNCLQDLNIKMENNQKIGIVGRTGAGKTSITLALTRIIDLVSGDLIINGKSIKQYSLQELRGIISVVSQESYIFEGTLKQNLDPYEKYSEQQILQVYQQCGFSVFSSFKKGLQTEIKQLGENLSEGEKQLVSIARILLRKNKIIIVDEPTSHIDEKMEQHITKILNENFKDCLMITIAHKIKTILESDKILVLDHGKVVEYDHPSVLLSNEKSQFSEILKLINKNRIN
ncbi:ABC transporter C family protein (macronuclear) [Tetrahymena thermophila SB210]|uniref:ABC transporter C family protein n=1 Tax=Tetrahymena thermophila (strain SB210) TaxID=312017 RepID=I7LU71_TETTS|nr:ABC transporter C family protein [Tetrahymena thermophila SB210]EAR90721.2 ABC transporter C family protein [Tetrahymena thermophila SB210]|eukprot:XP_001010966.2 ABC transporter C family protein [Tetrahymena thermophila SB210]